MIEQEKRGPGSPKNEGVKKGRSSWQPASVTDVVNKEDGYRYRWSNKTQDTLAKRKAEGWETVSAIMGDGANAVDSGRMDDGKQVTSVYEKNDVILQRIPEELALERDAYFNGETERRTAGLTAHVKKEVGKQGGETHGEITISSRSGTRIID